MCRSAPKKPNSVSSLPFTQRPKGPQKYQKKGLDLVVPARWLGAGVSQSESSDDFGTYTVKGATHPCRHGDQWETGEAQVGHWSYSHDHV